MERNGIPGNSAGLSEIFGAEKFCWKITRYRLEIINTEFRPTDRQKKKKKKEGNLNSVLFNPNRFVPSWIARVAIAIYILFSPHNSVLVVYPTAKCEGKKKDYWLREK